LRHTRREKMIGVLDHGEIELVDHMGDDNSIVRAARVSHAANMKTGEDSAADFKLVDYLYRNGHTSPFEHVIFTFRVKAPIFVFRQWHRHRTWSFNEVSARYTELPEEFYVPEPDNIGAQDAVNHQSRIMDNGADDQRAYEVRRIMRQQNQAAFMAYGDLLKAGVARELARTVLPVATYSEMYATIDLHNLLKFISERIAEGAQYEIRVYAQAMLSVIERQVPAAVAAWRTHHGEGK
jgi:thymidylate synthase (FAD)